MNPPIPSLPAGLSLKSGTLGILRPISRSCYLSLRCLGSYLFYSIPLTACSIAPCPRHRYFDIKKIIASPSTSHSNPNIRSIGALNRIGVLRGIITPTPHGSSPAGSLSFAGLLIQKIYPRYSDGSFFTDAIPRGSSSGFLPANAPPPRPSNPVGETFASISTAQIDRFLSIFLLVGSFLARFYRSLTLNRKLPYYSCYSSSN